MTMTTSFTRLAAALIVASVASVIYAQTDDNAAPATGPIPGIVDCTRVIFLFENLQTATNETRYRTKAAYDADSIGECCQVCFTDRKCLAFTFDLNPGENFGCSLRTEAVRGSRADIVGCEGCLSGVYTNVTTNNVSDTSEAVAYSLNSTALAEIYTNSSGRRLLRDNYEVHLKFS